MFDNLDQRIFSLARITALQDLMGPDASMLDVQAFAKQATALFLIGWGIGGFCPGPAVAVLSLGLVEPPHLGQLIAKCAQAQSAARTAAAPLTTALPITASHESQE